MMMQLRKIQEEQQERLEREQNLCLISDRVVTARQHIALQEPIPFEQILSKLLEETILDEQILPKLLEETILDEQILPKLLEETTYGGDNHEDFGLIWYGAVGDENKFEIITKPKLRNVINYFKRYRTSDKFLRFVSSIHIEKVFIILAHCCRNELQQLLTELHDIISVTYIYIYSKEKQIIEETEWRKFWKFHGTFTKTDDLLLQLMVDVKSINILSFDIIKIHGDESSVTDLTKESCAFLKSKLLLDHLLSMPAPQVAKRDIILEFRKEYEGNQKQIEYIEKFATDYNADDAISWYTSTSCVCKLINKALRLQDMNVIFKFRFFIADLYHQLSNLWESQSKNQVSLTVYRGQQLPVKDLDKVRNNIGSLISMTSFVSTSRTEQVANIFCGDQRSTPLLAVLFEILIDPRFIVVPFADITELSCIPGEEEVLLCLNFIFHVDEVIEGSNGVWNIKLSTSSEQKADLDRLVTSLGNRIDESTANTPIQDHFVKISCAIGASNVLKEFYLNCLNETKNDPSRIWTIHMNLGFVSHQEGNISMVLEHYLRAYTMIEKNLKSSQHQQQTKSSFVKLCHCLVNIFLEENNYEEALKYFWPSVKFDIDHTPADYKAFNQQCLRIASRYTKVGDFKTALDFYSQLLSHIFTLSLKNTTICIDDIYYQIANVYECLCNKRLARKYATLAYESAIKAVAANHKYIVTYKQSKEKVAALVDMNQLDEIESVFIKENHLFEYDIDDLVTLENDNNSSFDFIVIVWLNPPFNEDTLPLTDCTQKVFHDENHCQSYLSSVIRQSIFLVLFGSLEQYRVKIFMEYSSVASVYILNAGEMSSTVASQGTKYYQFFHSYTYLIETIYNDVKTFYNNLLSIDIFNPEQPSNKDTNISFIKYYTFVQIMLMTPEYHQLEDKPFPSNHYELNKAIVQRNISELYKYHEIVESVHYTINRSWKTTFENISAKFTVYYSGIIEFDKVDVLEHNIGAYLSLNNFICAYSDQYFAAQQVYTRVKNNWNRSYYSPIMIEINIDTSLTTQFPYAPLNKILHSNDEGLAFSLGSVFRIEGIKYIFYGDVKYYYLELTLSTIHPLIKKIFEKIKQEIHYDSDSFLSFGRFLYYLNENYKATIFFSKFLRQSRSKDVHQTTVAHIMLGNISTKNHNFEAAVNYYNKAIEIHYSNSRFPQIELAKAYRKLGGIFLHMGKTRIARLNYLKAIETSRLVQSCQSQSDLSLSLIHSGLYYMKKHQFQIANDYFTKAIECLGNDNSQYDSYLSLSSFYKGILCHRLGKYHEAIEFHSNALKIYLISEMSYNTQYIKSNYYYLGFNYFLLELYDDSLSCFLRVIENNKDEDHIALSCNYIGSIYYRRRNYQQSLQWYQTSLKNATMSRKANILHNMGTIYVKMKSTENALKYFDNAFNCELEFLAGTYPSIMTYYSYTKKIEVVHEQTNETSHVHDRKLEIIANLLESRDDASSNWVIILFDPDHLIQDYKKIRRLYSNDEIAEYLANCKARRIFIITYAEFSRLLDHKEKTIFIYLLLLNGRKVSQKNVRGTDNNMDELINLLTKDLIDS
ncbi:unnamed protein product [Rotaria magnacalcarata]|uniref:NAD(P)(+)--arginine ADP-ribosyltransferase n=1 Tax=Rotaria magnacalcarata TaxID=392030 RepID=A0A819H3V4_9BILA|nr:unnamed protein product [Rotaria magnacalcarata]CAF2143106.1 unnamed protein product [Rotaria magnacalcarata]CAF3891805.1 unnamed protein product [Rotaria magnacalcarata]CAF4141491.1 unnamed protein product [Rotaria magnacalcarata]